MDKVLELVFRNGAGTEVTISLPNPKDGLKSTDTDTVMKDVIDKNVFNTKGGALSKIVGARIRSTDVTPLA